jgi:hypothetical protein
MDSGLAGRQVGLADLRLIKMPISGRPEIGARAAE